MISRIQAQLEAIYALEVEHRATAFVVEDGQIARALGATGRTDEELLVQQEGDGDLELALYFSPRLLADFQADATGAGTAFLDAKLDGYCRIAEGVSHFMYLLFVAEHGRKVSWLELEAQAEVDKFASCLLHRWKDNARSWAQELHQRLFDHVSYNPLLSAAERWRYEEANRLSRTYCLKLVRLTMTGRLDRLLSELRYCYRLGAEAKLDYLSRAA